MGGMIAAVARNGYAATTVSEVVALAGVSNTTFYDHFRSKQDCFLATFDEIVARASKQVGEAYRSESDFRQRLHAALERFMDIVIAEPAATHLVVVDSLSLGAEGVAHREPAADAFERMFRQSFEKEPDRGEVSDLTIRAINAGIRRVVYRRLLERQTELLRGNVDDLLDWGLSYQRPGGANASSLPAPPKSKVPKATATEGEVGELSWEEPPDSARSRETLSQRERIVRAAAMVAAKHGYQRLTIPAISSTAGVSNQTFYEYFTSKEAAFISALDILGPRAVARIGVAMRGSDSWPEAIVAGLDTLLRFVAEDPLLTRIAFFEALGAGSASRNRIGVMMDNWTALIRPGPGDVEEPVPDVIVEAIIGGIWAVIQHEIANKRNAGLPELLPEVAFIALAPFGMA
jgi:AcrR family transcriptional regulator